MRYIIFTILLFSVSLADSIYFMPYQADAAITHLIKEIGKAKKEVNISIYSFTNREIAKAIRDSAKKGVKYNIIFDYKQNVGDQYSQIGYLAKLKNINVCTLQSRISDNKKYNGIMHHKLAIIDNKTIIIGSANWSKSAFAINHEILIISNNKEYISSANTYFAKMKSECKEY